VTLLDTTARIEPTEVADPRDPHSRLAQLLGPDLTVIGDEPGAGVVVGIGRIDGGDVIAFATDPTVQGGALGRDGCLSIVAAYERALRHRLPIVGVWHSGGARLAEGVASLDGVGQVFAAMTAASGRVPQVSVVLGPAAGGAAYGPALTDVVVLGPHGRVFVTGPDVVRSVTGEDVDMLRLGGPEPHGRRSGVVHLVADTDDDAFAQARAAVTLLARPGRLTTVEDRAFADLLPESARRAYDVKPLIGRLLDEPMLELHPRWAPNVVTALGRFGGRAVGVVANNPLRLGGCLDASAADKAARFVRMCDAFGLPLLVVVDVPGYLPGVGQEWDGVVRRGAKLLHAFAECVVPRVTVITRKAYGGAYIAMNSRSLGATRVLAWEGAEVAVMGSVAAVRILHRRRLADVPEEARAPLEIELADEHERLSGGLSRAVDLSVVDDVIAPDRTRTAIADALQRAETHRRLRGQHGNIPL
jgi:acetyl-CoA/propionyl-CoA carboxylase carboxyl transferase subunit